MLDAIFLLTVSLLLDLAALLGTTYEGANIIVFYLLVPLVLCGMLDALLEWSPFTKILVAFWAGFLLAAGTFAEKADDLFQTAVMLLRSGEPLGISYVTASVLVCLVAPAMTFGILLHLLRRKWRNSHGRS